MRKKSTDPVKSSKRTEAAADPGDPPLRTAAEARLARIVPPQEPVRPADELLHDLRVHQIELEMQNEELRRARIALEESRDRYLNLYEFAPVGYLTLTGSRQIAEINLAGAALLGGERAELLQWPFDHFVAAEDRDRWYLLFASVMGSAGGRGGIELKLPRGDGAAIYVHLDCLRIEVTGAPPEMRLTLTDISAMALNKQLLTAQKELDETAHYSRSLIEASLDPLVTIGIDGKVMDVNIATEAVTGVARGTLIGSDFADYFTEPEQARAGYRQVFEQGTVSNYSLTIRHVSGNLTEVLYNASIFRNKNMEVAGVFAAARDITELKQKEAALEQSENRFRSLVETTSDWIWEVDENGVYTYASPRVHALLGYQPAEVVGKTAFDLMPDGEAKRVTEVFGRLAAARQPLINLENTCLHKEGYPVVLETSALPVIDQDGRFRGYRGMDHNITERKRIEAAFHEVSRHNEMILEAAGEGICGVDGERRIHFINPAALAMLGYEKNELLGLDSHAVLHHSKPDGSPYPQEDCPMHQSVFDGLTVRGKEETLWRKDGSALPVLYSSTPTREDDKVTGAVVAFQDITELKRYQTQLERQSNYDELTGLPNRNLLTDRLAYAVARCQRERTKLAVLVLNLDRFGEINDSMGRVVGNDILRETAERLRQLVREMDIVARSAGDEFVLVGEVAEEEEAAYLARRVLETLSQPFFVEERELFLYASVGLGVLPRDGTNGETLLNNALAAMYRAKASGGNHFLFYSAEMNAHTLEHLNLENDLRRAIERDELLLYYQPQLSLRSGEIIGMEALLRWRHPVRGLVSPMEFIPLAETTGLIVPIGEWVLRTACQQNRAWQVAGLNAVSVAVNLSARQFSGQDMVALTAKVLRETGLDPRYLELELTESMAMGDAENFVGMTGKFKSLSVSLSIDDFGTGYSSLSYLKRFALDRLKIDQSFVRDIVYDASSAAIVAAVIALGHGLGLSVIAEGVETEAQLSFLCGHGCDEMQGYYFSRPLPAAEFEQLLREERKLPLPATTHLSGNTLLLVDDEPSILSSLSRQLRREGYHILIATSAQEGMELLATHPIGVVMSDQRMPEMTGAEFLAKVRAMYPDTVRIILSGYSDLKSITDVVNRGEIYKFLEKPWDETVLREILRDAFRYYDARQASRQAAIPHA